MYKIAYVIKGLLSPKNINQKKNLIMILYNGTASQEQESLSAFSPVIMTIRRRTERLTTRLRGRQGVTWKGNNGDIRGKVPRIQTTSRNGHTHGDLLVKVTTQGVRTNCDTWS